MTFANPYKYHLLSPTADQEVIWDESIMITDKMFKQQEHKLCR